MPAKPLADKFPGGGIRVHILFIRWAGALLLALALVNLVQASTHEQSLIVLDPLLGTAFRLAVLAVGFMELAVALVCLFGHQTGFQSGLIAWLATGFAVYRIGLLWQGCHTRWGCIGNPLETLHLLSGQADYCLNFLLTSLLLGGYATLVWLKFGKPAPMRIGNERIEGLKMACPACGVHIKFGVQNLGRKIPCPQCRTTITLRKPDRLKMACNFCQEHIEFPAHAIGEKLPCPHCKMDITLKEPA